MSNLDWLVLVLTLFIIVAYGIWKSRGTRKLNSYLLADRELPWYHVGLSVMATQASAITFLSAPAQGYTSGLAFVQFYFGLPLATILLCTTFIPIFRGLNVYTAYEYLEKRFDSRTRSLTSFLFLLQRGISTGITIYAPAIVLSTILNVSIVYTTFIIGALVIAYTVFGGTKAVSYTQVLQMAIIFSGLFTAVYMIFKLLPENVGIKEALAIAGSTGKLNAIDTSFDLENRYNLWSGLIGGFFLQLSYFGTDQSQVGRYLTGSSVSQSRLGLIMNGFVKIPMQFFILLIGVFVFVFYQFNPSPLFFNKVEEEKILSSDYRGQYQELQDEFVKLQDDKKSLSAAYSEKASEEVKTSIQLLNEKEIKLRKQAAAMIKESDPLADANDSNYIFLHFVLQSLPAGLIGLIIAIVFLAAMGSTASGLNSLASTTIVDVYKRNIKEDESEEHYVRASRIATTAWGVFCLLVALLASRAGNLIEAVNILGSLFYGTILGIFMTAFFLPKVQGRAVFHAAIITECFIVLAWYFDLTAFLWLNVIGCLMVMTLALSLQGIKKGPKGPFKEG